jgi:hypothetical protein
MYRYLQTITFKVEENYKEEENSENSSVLTNLIQNKLVGSSHHQ